MLEFNPYFRANAWELMEDPVFDEVRDHKLEFDAKYVISADNDIEMISSNIEKIGETSTKT